MKRKRLPLFALALSLFLLLSACAARPVPPAVTTAAGEDEPTEPARHHEASAEQRETDTSFSADEEKSIYAGTWKYVVGSGEDERVYRLILGEDGSAQLVFQNGIGELLALSGGTWSVKHKERLTIELVPDVRRETDAKPFGGEYAARLGVSDMSLTLSCEKGASPLVPGHENRPAVFRSESVCPEEDSEGIKKRLCDAVLRRYEEMNGEPYPGTAAVEGVGRDGWTVHLYEDMGDHVATAGRYTVDPVTMMGTDDITGAEIDFSAYCD